MGKGDILASGGKRANFMMGGDSKDAPIDLKNVAPEETEKLADLVDNSAIFSPKAPAVIYRGKPMGDRVLVKRITRESNSQIVIPDAAKAKSDMGIVVGVGSGLVDITSGVRTPLDVRVGELVLFDRFAAVGGEVSLLDEKGEESEHLILQACDILLSLEEVRTTDSAIQ
jgi:chaperonin GroES